MIPRTNRPMTSGLNRFGLAAIVLIGLVLSGCGGSSKLSISLSRSDGFDTPVYIGIFYLSQEQVLDGEPLHELIDNPESFTEGVIDRESLTIYPGDTKPILKEKPNPAITWILIVADVEDSPCARAKHAIVPGSSAEFTVHVQEKCLEIVSKK